MPAPLRTYLREEAAGGIVLMAVAAVALGWANSPWRDAYAALVDSGLRHWVNDRLMALSFLVVGLEIKRELVAGELATWRRAALPVVAAAGGMAVPAAIYAAVNAGRPGAPGWGVPMATDIAFALGVLALLGPRVPAGAQGVPAHPCRGRRPGLGRGGGPVLQPRERQPGPVRGGRRPARPGPGGGLAGRAAWLPPPPAERVPGRAPVRAGQRRGVDRAGGAGRGRVGGGVRRGPGRPGARQAGRHHRRHLAGRPPRLGRPARGGELGPAGRGGNGGRDRLHRAPVRGRPGLPRRPLRRPGQARPAGGLGRLRPRRRPGPDQKRRTVPTDGWMKAPGKAAARRWVAFPPVQCRGTNRPNPSSAKAATGGAMMGSKMAPVRWKPPTKPAIWSRPVRRLALRRTFTAPAWGSRPRTR